MLGYQHIYHAGNFADLHKHALLAKTLAALKNKAPRLWAIDTHAGRGMYDLLSEEAQKGGEARNGILAMDPFRDPASPIAEYAAALKKHNPDGPIVRYPGSAQLIRDILRDTDKAVFTELHPGECRILQENFAATRNTQVFNRDGFATLAASMPPPEPYGIAVIDPPYEIKSDYADVPRHLRQARAKWPKGVFFIWYPVLKTAPHIDMLAALRHADIRDALVSEIRLHDVPEEGFAMYGSGVIIINPPLPEIAVRETAQYIAGNLPGDIAAETYWLDNKAMVDGRLIL